MSTKITSSAIVEAEKFTWQSSMYTLLQEALVDAFNEAIPNEVLEDIDWKDEDEIRSVVDETGLLDRVLTLTREKFLERDPI